MKKTKELLLFLAALLAPIAIFFIVLALSSVLSPRFVGVENYVRLFFRDQTFAKALLNTFLGPFIFSFLTVALFAVIVFIARKKIKAPRKVFYIGSIFVGAITALVYVVYSNMAFLLVPAQQYASHTLVSHIVNYSPTVFAVSDVLLCLYIGVFTAFIFWIIESIIYVVKFFRRKRDRK